MIEQLRGTSRGIVVGTKIKLALQILAQHFKELYYKVTKSYRYANVSDFALFMFSRDLVPENNVD